MKHYYNHLLWHLGGCSIWYQAVKMFFTFLTIFITLSVIQCLIAWDAAAQVCQPGGHSLTHFCGKGFTFLSLFTNQQS